MLDDDQPEKEKAPKWPAIVDLFSNEVGPARNWQDAEIIGDMEDLCKIFNEAFPGQMYTFDDMRLALHAMRIPHERNENNNKYYYLAKWK